MEMEKDGRTTISTRAAGLTCHPSRPFMLASSSRDSTVRLWSLTSLTQPLEINILAGKPSNYSLGTTGQGARKQVVSVSALKRMNSLQ